MSRNFMVVTEPEAAARQFAEIYPGRKQVLQNLLETIDGLRAQVSNFPEQAVGLVRRAITESDDKFAEAADFLLDEVPSHEWDSIEERVGEYLGLVDGDAEGGDETVVGRHTIEAHGVQLAPGMRMYSGTIKSEGEPLDQDQLREVIAQSLGVEPSSILLLAHNGAAGDPDKLVDLLLGGRAA